MGLPKGRTNNPAGRAKGSTNKVTTKVKGIIADIFETKMNTIKEDIDKLDPKDRLEFFIKLLPYVVAKRAPENEQGENVPTILIEAAPGVDISKLLEDGK